MFIKSNQIKSQLSYFDTSNMQAFNFDIINILKI